MKDDVKLKKCDLSKCEGMCCYDGVYLEDGEEDKLRNIVIDNEEFFSFLPDDFIVLGSWESTSGKKTQVKPFKYTNPNFPKHFNRTRCVFSLDDARCSLQVLANNNNQHSFSLKPKGCWMHPLSLTNDQISSPPTKDDDPCNLGPKYLGFASFTECGEHNEHGDMWTEVLKTEIEYYNKMKLSRN